jgi:hypothetical protein
VTGARAAGALIACQALGSGAFAGAGVVAVGPSAVWLGIVGSILGAWLAGVRVVRPGDRGAMRRLAVASGLAHAGAAGIVYVAAWARWTAAFALPASALLVVVPGVAFAAGLLGLVSALCGLDAARAGR